MRRVTRGRQTLREGECDAALIVAVNLNLHPQTFAELAQAGQLSPRGRCATFDAASDGFVRGEGVVGMLVRRTADAVAAGDDILAEIAGTGVNQDGRTATLPAPNGPSQTELVRRVLKVARVAPAEVNFVETHGSGTALGDAIEV